MYERRERRERRYDRPPREMHKITCADCGQDAEVPSKPSGDRPVYCRECYQKHRPARCGEKTTRSSYIPKLGEILANLNGKM